MHYKPLNLLTVVDYVRHNISSCPNLPPDASLLAREITDGYVNLIFVVEAQTPERQSILLKQALPYMKRIGPTWPLSFRRNQVEAEALIFYNRVSPGLSPRFYSYDEDMHVILMEHLSDHVLLSKYLTDRIRLPNLIDHVSSFFAQTAFFSSDFFLSPAKKMMFREKFLNSDMCRMTEDLVFTHPFISHRNNKWNTIIDVEVLRIRADKHLKLKIDEIKNEFMRSEQTLIHGDFHTDSMMVTKTDTRVIDPEFAFIGPTAYDLGAMMTNLILYCLSHFAYTNELKKRAEYQQLLLVGLCECWNKFAAKFTELSLSMAKREDVYIGHVDLGHGDQVRGHATEKYLVRVLRDAVGFAGCRILRHLIGIFTFHEILRISDLETRSTVEKALIAVSTRMLKEREFIQTAADLLVIIKEEARDLIAFPL